MTINLDKRVFDSLPVSDVGHFCFKPMVPVYQSGMRNRGAQGVNEYRIQFFNTLSPGQRALCMFFSYYDHASRSEDDFKSITDNYLSAKIFGGVKKAAEYFNDDDMACLLLRIEQILPENKQDTLTVLYHQLCEISQSSLVRIGSRIKEAPEDFVNLQ